MAKSYHRDFWAAKYVHHSGVSNDYYNDDILTSIEILPLLLYN